MVSNTMYENYEKPIKGKIINLHDKQLLFPDDDDNDIIIVNEDYSRNTDDLIGEHADDSGDDERVTTPPLKELIADNYHWMTSDWSPCTAHCGQTGHQIRGAVCQLKTPNLTKTVETNECVTRGLSPPIVMQDCTPPFCATWRTSAWSTPKCLSSGSAIQRRRVECVTNNGTVVPNQHCDFGIEPETTRREPQHCHAAWATGPWSKCIGPCGKAGREHRVLRCVWRATGVRKRSRRERSAAAACEGLDRPKVVRHCRTPPCLWKNGVCKDTSRFCENVRAMNMCALHRFKELCCKSCSLNYVV